MLARGRPRDRPTPRPPLAAVNSSSRTTILGASARAVTPSTPCSPRQADARTRCMHDVPASAPAESRPPLGPEGLVVLFAANRWDDVKPSDRHMAERLRHVRRPVRRSPDLAPHAVQQPGRAPRHGARGCGWSRRGSCATPARGAEAGPSGDGRADLADDAPAVPRGPQPRRTRPRRIATGVSRRLRAPASAARVPVDRLPSAGAAYWGASADRLRLGEERLARSSDLVVAVNEGAVTAGGSGACAPSTCPTAAIPPPSPGWMPSTPQPTSP